MSREPGHSDAEPAGPSLVHSIVEGLASLRLTIALLSLSLIMIFVATLDQVHLGVWGVQKKYFHAFFVLARIPGSDLSLPIFPGGYLLGAALLANLVTAHAVRFRLSWRKSGIWLTHFGLILLLIGEGLSGLMQRDGQVRLDVGQTRRYVESFREYELAVTDATAPGYDEVVAIPAARIAAMDPIQHPKLPFVLKAVAYFSNATLRMRSQLPNPPPSIATMGDGKDMIAEPAALTYKEDEANWPTSYVELTGPDGSLGVWLVSAVLEEPQVFTYQGRTWQMALRARRDYLPFILTLGKFTHDIYPGTDIPKNFASTLRLRSDDGRDDRSVLVSMNNPLRYGGFAFYQAGYANNDRTSVLQAVRNPSWQIPYVSCALIALGLLLQFGLSLLGFFRKRSASVTKAAAAVSPPRPVAVKRHASIVIPAIALVWVAFTLVPRGDSGPFDLSGFGRLPVLSGGRIKPLDTIARTGLLMLQGRQRVTTRDGRELLPDAWLLDVLFKADAADAYPVFRIDNPDVLSIFNLARADGEGGVRFSLIQLQSGLGELDRQARLAEPVENAARTPFQNAVVELQQHVGYYDRLKFSLQPPDSTDFLQDLADPARLAAERAAFETMDSFSLVRAVPPAAGTAGPAEWSNAGHSLLNARAPADVEQHVRMYAAIGRAWRGGQTTGFDAPIREYRRELARSFPVESRRADAEAYFNRAEPFITSLYLYVAAFLLAAASWLAAPEALGRAAFRVMALAFALATCGILARMWLEGRPPVTNLYSSALFIGWGSVGLCLILERLHRNAVASAAGSLIGFSTLVIAHHLSLSGDTLEMMRAVLDSNFWLSTHVVTVTTGYASTFLAGFLAIVYIARGMFTRSLDARTADSLARMVYGIVCFATLFSFVGTMLGGIWADQSWGRFWGWDPKENGALLIVIWNAIILHCRWGGLVRQRGLMALAVFGNIVTAWSWFGTNMLGVGLHSYGFTSAAFHGLIAFVASQLALIALTALPIRTWRSFRSGAAA